MTKIQSWLGGKQDGASWPPEEPSGEKGRFYRWPDGTFRREPPPANRPRKYGDAPQVIFDSMPKQVHHGVGREIESRSEWKAADIEAGTISFGSVEDARPRVDQANLEKARKAEKRKASLTALQAYRQNPVEVSQRVRKQNEERLENLEKMGIKIDE